MMAATLFSGQVPASQTVRWSTDQWPQSWHVTWSIVPTSAGSGGPQVEWTVEIERASSEHVTYWISVTNLTQSSVDYDARYAVLNA